MSSVRMCDACGIIFSEADEGWATAPVSRRVWSDRLGRYETTTDDEDRCSKCAGPPRGRHLVPQVALPGMEDVTQ